MKASEEIRSILDRCKSGELEHRQGDWVCGTSRCVAGWKSHLDFAKADPDKRPTSDNILNWISRINPNWFFDDYARVKWGLTKNQARKLFSGGATFPQQYAVVEELEAQGK